MRVMSKQSTTHGLGYFSHLRFSLSLSVKYHLIGLTCMIHSVFPSMFPKYPRVAGKELYETLLVEGQDVNMDKLILQNILLKRILSLNIEGRADEAVRILKEIDSYDLD